MIEVQFLNIFFKIRIAQYNLTQFDKALESLEEGLKKAEKESETKRNLFNDWIKKCEKEIKPTQITQTQEAPKVQHTPTIK